MSQQEHNADCIMACEIARAFPAAYDLMPPDVVVGFVNYHRLAKNRLEATLEDVRGNLAYAPTIAYSPWHIVDCLTLAPPRRSHFEALYQCGPIGNTADGRTVVLEKIGCIPPKAFTTDFTGEEMVRHATYNRQAAFALNRTISHQHGRRLRKIVCIIDMKGMSMAHLSKAFLTRTSLYIKTLTPLFPEASDANYIINAPTIFRAAWNFCKPLLEAETINKCGIFGGPATYQPAFEKLGIRTSASMSDAKPSWSEAVKELCLQETGVRELGGDQANDVGADADKPRASRPSLTPYLTPEESKVYQCGLAALAQPLAATPTWLAAQLSRAPSTTSSSLPSPSSSSRHRSRAPSVDLAPFAPATAQLPPPPAVTPDDDDGDEAEAPSATRTPRDSAPMGAMALATLPPPQQQQQQPSQPTQPSLQPDSPKTDSPNLVTARLHGRHLHATGSSALHSRASQRSKLASGSSAAASRADEPSVAVMCLGAMALAAAIGAHVYLDGRVCH